MRELSEGERPRDWANDTVEGARAERVALTRCGDDFDSPARCADGSDARARRGDGSDAPRRRELPPIAAPQQYQMQFSTSEEHVRLVERANALLARSSPGVSLGELHLLTRARLASRRRQRLTLPPPTTVTTCQAPTPGVCTSRHRDSASRVSQLNRQARHLASEGLTFRPG